MVSVHIYWQGKVSIIHGEWNGTVYKVQVQKDPINISGPFQ